MLRPAAFALLLTLPLLLLPSVPADPEPCPAYEAVDVQVHEAELGFKAGWGGRFVLGFPTSYMAWDDPSLRFPERIFSVTFYWESNGVPGLQRNDVSCYEVDWWEADTIWF